MKPTTDVPQFINPLPHERAIAERELGEELTRRRVQPDGQFGYQPWSNRLRNAKGGTALLRFKQDGKDAFLPLVQALDLLLSDKNPERVAYEAAMHKATLDAMWMADLATRRDAALAAFAEEERKGRPASFKANAKDAPGWIAVVSKHDRMLRLPAVAGFTGVVVPAMGEAIVARAYFEKVITTPVWESWFKPGLLAVGRAVHTDPTPKLVKPTAAPPAADAGHWEKIARQTKEVFAKLGYFGASTPGEP
jgi:hypothetical protein